MKPNPVQSEMPILHGNVHSFVVRIWKDATDEKGLVSDWHGSIDHVGSNQRFYFYKLESMMQFINECTGVGLNPVKGWCKRLLTRLKAIFCVLI